MVEVAEHMAGEAFSLSHPSPLAEVDLVVEAPGVEEAVPVALEGLEEVALVVVEPLEAGKRM